ncbi:SAM-dependent methyltransferase [Plantactinospora sp. KLBMP9567]|uniref:SAM-dependent methyltransferase n=1 Tax=Plantactinospora sp. KLBMP9567 TaxID=3085900 RepID=UPI002982727F|nr:SAM-dependent methyltransferase [Plantactinospora sp. KLBMP9567]MDW5329534.1 SAM-dependent methyltransferase [Plantactinospora sp. KLBMP9567]
MSGETTVGEKPLGAVAKTALWTAAARARESARPDRLFHDPLAHLLAGDEGRRLLSHFHTDRAPTDGNPFLAIRTRWFDDFLTRAVRPGCQVVALAAGLDTRAFRLSWPDDTVLFELDQPDLLAAKAHRLREHLGRARCRRREVPVDLGGDWVGHLVDAGYAPDRPTVWFAEGLLFYLSADAARAVLRRAASLSVPGCRLAADLIGTGVFKFPYTRGFLRRLEAAGSPWRFGTDEPGRFVADADWRVDSVLEPGMPGADYGRWPAASILPAAVRVPRSYLLAATAPPVP